MHKDPPLIHPDHLKWAIWAIKAQIIRYEHKIECIHKGVTPATLEEWVDIIHHCKDALKAIENV